MTSSQRGVRLSPGRWLVTFLAQRVLSTRLKPLQLPFLTRPIAEPTTVMVPTRHGPVRCYLYRPHPDAPLATGQGIPPVHINIHGGGFIFTNPRQDDHIANYIAAEVGVVVVSIDYSTAPQVLYPVAEEQCFDVLRWVAAEGASEHGWDGNRVSIGGGSAGGKLSLNVLQLAYKNSGPSVRAATLLVPFVDATLPAESYDSKSEKPTISPFAMKLILGAYFADVARRSDPLASPALDPDLQSALPPTLVLTGEYDTVRTQAADLFEKLIEQGAPVTYREFAESDHDWSVNTKTPITVVHETLELIAGHLRVYLADTDPAAVEDPRSE